MSETNSELSYEDITSWAQHANTVISYRNQNSYTYLPGTGAIDQLIDLGSSRFRDLFASDRVAALKVFVDSVTALFHDAQAADKRRADFAKAVDEGIVERAPMAWLILTTKI